MTISKTARTKRSEFDKQITRIEMWSTNSVTTRTTSQSELISIKSKILKNFYCDKNYKLRVMIRYLFSECLKKRIDAVFFISILIYGYWIDGSKYSNENVLTAN